MFISQRFDDCHEARNGKCGQTAPKPFFEPVLSKSGQLFQHRREYFYILEFPPNGARSQTFAIRYSGWNPGNKTEIPGKNFCGV